MGIFRANQGVSDADFRREVRMLREEIEQVQLALKKLRGVVYAAKRYAAAEAEDDAKQLEPGGMSRAELKAHLVRSGTFIPGRPAVHK